MAENLKISLNKRFIDISKLLVEANLVPTIKEFCSQIGIHQQVLSDIRTNKRGVTVEILSNMLSVFGVNPSFLLEGTGLIFNFDIVQLNYPDKMQGLMKGLMEGFEKSQYQTPQKNSSFSTQNETPQLYNTSEEAHSLVKEEQAFLNREGGVIVKYVDEHARAGFQVGFSQEQIRELPTFSLPGLEKGEYFAFNVEGDSMYSTLSNGDIVIAKKVEQTTYARNGEIYVINTTDGLLIKRIKKETAGLTIVSDNDYYPADIIDYEHIRGVYHVKRVISANLGRKNQKEQELIALYKEIKALNSH